MYIKTLSSTPIGKQNISNEIFTLLKKMIITAQIKPGQAISEKEIADALKVSKTPVRETFIRLNEEGLVETKPKSGTCVTSINLDELYEAATLREVLEIKSVELATQCATPKDIFILTSIVNAQKTALKDNDTEKFRLEDEKMHEELTKIARIPKAWMLINRVKTCIDRVRRLGPNINMDHCEKMVAQHEKIIIAMKTKNVDEAKNAIETHLREIFKAVEEVIMQGHGDYFESSLSLDGSNTKNNFKD